MIKSGAIKSCRANNVKSIAIKCTDESNKSVHGKPSTNRIIFARTLMEMFAFPKAYFTRQDESPKQTPQTAKRANVRKRSKQCNSFACQMGTHVTKWNPCSTTGPSPGTLVNISTRCRDKALQVIM